MSQRLPVNNFEWIEDASKLNEDFIKNYNEECDWEYFLKVDVQYPGNLHEIQSYLPCLTERTKFEIVEKLVSNLLDESEYVIHIRNLKQALNLALILKKTS